MPAALGFPLHALLAAMWAWQEVREPHVCVHACVRAWVCVRVCVSLCLATPLLFRVRCARAFVRESVTVCHRICACLNIHVR